MGGHFYCLIALSSAVSMSFLRAFAVLRFQFNYVFLRNNLIVSSFKRYIDPVLYIAVTADKHAMERIVVEIPGSTLLCLGATVHTTAFEHIWVQLFVVDVVKKIRLKENPLIHFFITVYNGIFKSVFIVNSF